MANASAADVLLVTVTEVETMAVLAAFGVGLRAKPRSVDGRVYFDLGKVNGGRVQLTQSEMGASGLGGSQHAVGKAIRALSPAAVIMVGIAFGMNPETQNIGDVLVSQHLRPYDTQRVGTQKDGAPDIILRDAKPDASPWLLGLFKSVAIAFPRAKVCFGTMLTGSKLVDHLGFREKLRASEPEAIGGEMEGLGLYVACHEEKVDWIIVKAICDFADGEKAKEKTERQAIAARNAATFVHHALNSVKVNWQEHHRPQPGLSTRTTTLRRPWMFVGVLLVAVLGLGAAWARPRPKPPSVAVGYPRSAVKTIADDCTKPWVILAGTGEKNGSSYHWPISHQTFRANRQFTIVAREPTHESEVHLATYRYDNNGYALVATCYDGATCNDIAAMYKGIVRSSTPIAFCGTSSHLSATPVSAFSWSTDPHQNLPEPNDTFARCARINACLIAMDRSIPGDPYLECQKAPQKFKLSCGMFDDCNDVWDCSMAIDARLRYWWFDR